MKSLTSTLKEKSNELKEFDLMLKPNDLRFLSPTIKHILHSIKAPFFL